ncbi:MAG: biotin/lipoyl-binding protein [Pyrinomonadaceae bacterium]
MKRRMILIAVFGVVAVLFAVTVLAYRRNQVVFAKTKAEAARAFNASADSTSLISAPGRVEPISEEIEVGAEVGGKIREVRVEEGDVVVSAQVLAVLANDDYAAQVRSAEAQVRDAEAQQAAAAARPSEPRPSSDASSTAPALKSVAKRARARRSGSDAAQRARRAGATAPAVSRRRHLARGI